MHCQWLHCQWLHWQWLHCQWLLCCHCSLLLLNDLMFILLGVGGVIYIPHWGWHVLVPLKSLGLHSQRVKMLALKLHSCSFCALCWQACTDQTSEQFSWAFSSPSNLSGGVCWLVCPQLRVIRSPDPHWLREQSDCFLLFWQGYFLPMWPLFLNWREELFCCLRSLSFYFFSWPCHESDLVAAVSKRGRVVLLDQSTPTRKLYIWPYVVNTQCRGSTSIHYK